MTYSTGTAKSDSNTGGLTGSNGGNVKNSYSTTDVIANDGSYYEMGGLIGITDGSIENSFTADTINVSGDDVNPISDYGCCSSSVSNAYWDESTLGLDSSGDESALSTNQLQGSSAESNLNGFDFNNVWKTVDGKYPVLRQMDKDTQIELR